MDSLDSKSFVVDGLGRSSCKRKIALGDNCFLHLEVDPYHPSLIPALRVSGPDAKSNAFQQRLVRNRRLWNSKSNDLATNLETLLEMKLPTKESPSSSTSASSSLEEKEGFECGICLAHLDSSGMSPSYSCENSKCSYMFHTQCLREWLETQNQEGKLGYLRGTCAYCSHHIKMQK
ncbi:FANCL C-terminal domain-containing protein [Obelidium mucronatum]|nr:FANCL C-terminal domain-containing protein [Obelidium mucronatum]